MQLRVTFREQHETGESRTGFSTSLRTKNTTPLRETVAFGVNAVRQFREEVEHGIRADRSFLLGSVESPSMERLLGSLEFDVPKVTLHKPRHIRQMLWPVRDVLSSRSDDVISFVNIEPTNDKEFFHSHDLSDRLVLITRGAGTLFVSPGDPKFFPRDLTQHDLSPGDIVFLSRGTGHQFRAGKDGAQAIVWHCPYIPHGEPEYETELKATNLAMLMPLKAVFADHQLRSLLYAVHLGYTEPVELCEALHIDRVTLDEATSRLETLNFLERVGIVGWRLHPTFRIEESEGRVDFIREEGERVAKVSAPLRK